MAIFLVIFKELNNIVRTYTKVTSLAKAWRLFDYLQYDKRSQSQFFSHGTNMLVEGNFELTDCYPESILVGEAAA